MYTRNIRPVRQEECLCWCPPSNPCANVLVDCTWEKTGMCAVQDSQSKHWFLSDKAESTEYTTKGFRFGGTIGVACDLTQNTMRFWIMINPCSLETYRPCSAAQPHPALITCRLCGRFRFRYRRDVQPCSWVVGPDMTADSFN